MVVVFTAQWQIVGLLTVGVDISGLKLISSQFGPSCDGEVTETEVMGFEAWGEEGSPGQLYTPPPVPRLTRVDGFQSIPAFKVVGDCLHCSSRGDWGGGSYNGQWKVLVRPAFEPLLPGQMQTVSRQNGAQLLLAGSRRCWQRGAGFQKELRTGRPARPHNHRALLTISCGERSASRYRVYEHPPLGVCSR